MHSLAFRSSITTRNLSIPAHLAVPILVFVLAACSSGGGSGSSSSGENTTAFSAPDCSTGVTSSDIDSAVPDWIKNNFTCIKAYVSGSDIVISTKNLPPWTSAYYYPSDPLYTSSMPPGNFTNPNKIAEQAYTLTIPANPAVAGSTTPTAPPVVGIGIDGVALFNGAANPPDLLADEIETMDTNTGHPTQGGIYHYHTEPAQLSASASEDDLIGVALDGFPIYGPKDESSSSYAFDEDVTGNTENWHDHATTLFPGGVPHYHVIVNYTEANSSSAQVELRFMVNLYAGTPGDATDNSASSSSTAFGGDAFLYHHHQGHPHPAMQ